MKIKNLVSIIAAIGLAVAGSVFANADERDIRLDENGRVIREYNTAEMHPALRSGTEAIVTQLPIVPIGDTAEDENTAELMADSDLVAHEIEKCTILLSEDTAQLIVRLNEFYDAKYKLYAELVDRNDNVVATQTGCEYDFESRWNCQLIYDLEYIPGFELNASENYFVKFTYSGDFNFVDATDREGFMVNDDPYLRSGEMIDADAGDFKLHVANFNPDYTYYVEIDGVRYEPTDISDGYLYVTAEDLDNYPYDYIPVSLYAHNGSFERYCGNIEIPFIVYGNDADDKHYNGLYIEKEIGLDTRALFFDIYNKENGAVYTAQEAANIKIHMLDTVTGANVGNATVQHYPSDNFVEAKINITTTPVNNRAYLVIVDDGYTIRTVTIYATNSPGFRFCAVDDGYGSYSSYDIPDRQNYTGMIFDSYNISDLSKLDISITDYEGNTVVALDKGSVRYRNNVTWANNVIDFTMTRKMRVDYDSEYLFTVNYNGETISVNECYFYPLYGSSSSYYIDGYITDSFATETNTYIVFGRRVEGFNEASLKYALYSRANGQKYFGTVERVICDDGWYKYLVLKFNHVLPDGNYGEWELLVCDESGGIVYREDGYDIHTDTLPYIYSYTYTDESGIVHLFCEGLTAGNYKMTTFDTAQNKAVSFPLTYTGTKGELTISTDKLCSVLPKNGCFYIEGNGKWIGEVEAWSFDLPFIPDNAFYAKHKKLTHHTAILCLPFGEYTQYRVSEDRDALTSIPFNAMKRNILFTLSAGDGQKTVYGQFKKADGTLSEIMSTKITCDAIAPVLSNFVGLPGKLVKENDDYLTFEFSFDSTEAGMISMSYYDANGNPITDNTTYCYDIVEGQNQKQISLWCYEDEDFSKTAKIKLFAIDASGNQSEIYEFDVSVIELYSNVDVAGGYIKVNNQTGYIEYAEITADELRIPSNANGITITGIAPYAFSDCNNITKVTIPATITEIPTDAFYGLTITEIVGKEGSAAQTFANNYGIGFEAITVEPGDVTNDGNVNRQDLLRLAKYFAGWDVEIDETASDVTADGNVNRQDLLRLAKYFAGWDVSLG